MYSLSKTVKVSRVPILDSKLLSAPITFLLPELQKLVLKAKNGDLILIFAFGTTLLYNSVQPREMIFLLAFTFSLSYLE